MWIALKLCLTYLGIWCYKNRYILSHFNILVVQSVLVSNDLSALLLSFPSLSLFRAPQKCQTAEQFLKFGTMKAL